MTYTISLKTLSYQIKINPKTGVLMDKIMDDKLMYISNYDKQNYSLKSLVEKF